MVEKTYNVLWNKSARKQVRKIYDYILEDSYQNAQKVLGDIIEATYKLKTKPTRFAQDKYKLNNDGSYRYFEMY